LRNAYTVSFSGNGRRIDDEYDDVTVLAHPLKSDDGIVGIVKINPLEPVVRIILIVQRRFGAVEPV
jgi:hypothetical protein